MCVPARFPLGLVTSDFIEKAWRTLLREIIVLQKRRSVALFMVAAGWSLDFVGARDSRSGLTSCTSPPLTESRGLSLLQNRVVLRYLIPALLLLTRAAMVFLG